MKNPTQIKIAKELGVTQQYVSKLARNGMPTTSVAAARAWVKKQAQKATTIPQPGSLTEARLKKVLLECSLLQARIERETDHSELMPTSDLKNALGLIMSMMNFGLIRDAENLAVQLVGLDGRGIYHELRKFLVGNFLQGALDMLNRLTIDPRLKQVAQQAVDSNIIKIGQMG